MKGRNSRKAEKLNCLLQTVPVARGLNPDGLKQISNFSKASYLGILLPCICNSTQMEMGAKNVNLWNFSSASSDDGAVLEGLVHQIQVPQMDV